MCLCAILMC
uniref:Uncharacterized protein n=1 Tax=Arundo donax TaxID=35708 RepID=A0A0A9AB69_ARUDO